MIFFVSPGHRKPRLSQGEATAVAAESKAKLVG